MNVRDFPSTERFRASSDFEVKLVTMKLFPNLNDSHNVWNNALTDGSFGDAAWNRDIRRTVRGGWYHDDGAAVCAARASRRQILANSVPLNITGKILFTGYSITLQVGMLRCTLPSAAAAQ